MTDYGIYDRSDDIASRLRMLVEVAERDQSSIGRTITIFVPVLTEAADVIARLCSELADERARSLGLARASCPHCHPQHDLPEEAT